jgi:hypothetical protein
MSRYTPTSCSGSLAQFAQEITPQMRGNTFTGDATVFTIRNPALRSGTR